MRALLQDLSWADILLLTVIGGCVFFAVRHSVRRKGQCEGGCARCAQRCGRPCAEMEKMQRKK